MLEDLNPPPNFPCYTHFEEESRAEYVLEWEGFSPHLHLHLYPRSRSFFHVGFDFHDPLILGHYAHILPMNDKDFDWVLEVPNGRENASHATRSSARSAHTKSRNGCKSCKKKRIKCDENKPICAQCAHRRIGCDYPTTEQPTKSLEHSLTPESARTKILAFMKNSGIPCDQFAEPKYKRIDAVELLHHWFDTTYPWIGTSEVQRIMQDHSFTLGFHAPHLMHGILAFAACHLSYLYPLEPKYEIASTIHYDRALVLYSNQISAYVGPDNADSLFGTCFLLGPMTFWNLSRPSDKPASRPDSHDHSTVDSADPSTMSSEKGHYLGDFTWLRTLQGGRILQTDPAVRPNLANSIWAPVFLKARAWEVDADVTNEFQTGSQAHQIITALKDLCDIQVNASSTDNSYQLPVQRLSRLFAAEPHRDKIGWFMVWVGVLSSDFLDLLDQNDSKALLILAHWCALIMKIDIWWITRSAKQQCIKACAYIDHFSEPDVRSLLEFPANACGYVSGR